MRILHDLSPDGARGMRALLRVLARFPADDVQHAIDYAVVKRAATAPSRTDDEMKIVARVAASAGATALDAPAAIAGKLARYFRDFPVNASVVAAFDDALQELAAAKGDADAAAARALLGTAASGLPLSSRERPAGAVAGGPFARFALAKKS